MRNITKMLLSSAILATGTMAADVMDVKQDIQNNGTININPGMNITVTEGKWIINKGTINFMKPLTGNGANTRFNITGTNGEEGYESGIINKGPEFVQIEGAPETQTPIIANANYFNLDNLGGTIQVKDPGGEENRPLDLENDCNYLTGGKIQMENGGLYNFLRNGGDDSLVDANNVIVLRGTHDVSSNMILLDHREAEDGANETSAGTGALEITNSFVNSDDYKSFKNGNNPKVVYDKIYGLEVNGFFKFSGTNTNFDQGKVEFMDGSSEFTSANSIFGTNDLTISGGNVNINLSNDDPVVLSGRTINVTSHKDGENDVYGCLVVTKGNVTLDKDSVLNLGYNPQN